MKKMYEEERMMYKEEGIKKDESPTKHLMIGIAGHDACRFKKRTVPGVRFFRKQDGHSIRTCNRPCVKTGSNIKSLLCLLCFLIFSYPR